MNIVLLEPEIPTNTGSIGRTCVVTGTTLHLIKPLGFALDDKNIKKAGLDYWEKLDLKIYANFEEFLRLNNHPTIFMATTKSTQTYCDVNFDIDSFIMFGKESAGIPEEILLSYKDTAIRIPMLAQQRSLNLATSVSIVLYEALRQNNFATLETVGNLHSNTW